MKRSLTSLTLVLLLFSSNLAQQSRDSQPQNPSNDQKARQTPRPDDDVVRITTNLVQVDAVITDKNGKPVNDLRPEELEILEDGKPQKITNFSFLSVAPGPDKETVAAKPDPNAPPVPSVPLRPEQVRRTVALVVDDLRLSFESTYYIRRALKKFVDEQVQPGDLVAIIRTAGGIGALQQFTSDKRQLYAAVDRVKWNLTSVTVSAFAPISSNAPSRLDPNSRGEDIDEFREEIFAVGTLGALNYVIRGMDGLPGRKSIVLLSDGLKIFNRADPANSSRVLMALQALADRANRASVVIYTLDTRGLVTFGPTAADSSAGMTAEQFEQELSDRRADYFESQNGLNYLAQRTGGFFIHDSNDLGKGIKRVIEDQKSYYLIGYRPNESTFDTVTGRRKFHKLSLKVLRPGKFNVRVRSGFYGISDDDMPAARGTVREKIYDALFSPFGSADVHLRLTSYFLNDARLGSAMRSMLHVDARDLSFIEQPDGWHQVVFDVIVAAFGDNGVLVDQLARTQTIRVRGNEYERLAKNGFVYSVTFPVKKAGAYQLRTALRDRSSERIGSASQFVEVPDIKKNKVTLSGIVVRGMSFEAYTKLLKGAPSSEHTEATVEESDPRANPAVREFHRGMAMVYAVAVYNSRVDKATGKPHLQVQSRLFRNGQQVFAGNQLPFDSGDQKDLKRLDFVGGIQLGTEMEPGEYVLQLLVTDLLANEKNNLATQWIGFEVVK